MRHLALAQADIHTPMLVPAASGGAIGGLPACRSTVPSVMRLPPKTRMPLPASPELRGTVEERKRISLELHDTVAQGLAGIALTLQALDFTYGDAMPEVVRMTLISCHDNARESLVHLRQAISPSLRASPQTLHEALLRLKDCNARATAKTRIDVSVSLENQLPQGVVHAFERIARESINNAIRHGHATQISVTVTKEVRGLLVMEIRDNGVGLEPIRSAEGFGLGVMAERARSVGAVLSIASGGVPGTTVTVILQGELS